MLWRGWLIEKVIEDAETPDVGWHKGERKPWWKEQQKMGSYGEPILCEDLGLWWNNRSETSTCGSFLLRFIVILFIYIDVMYPCFADTEKKLKLRSDLFRIKYLLLIFIIEGIREKCKKTTIKHFIRLYIYIIQ